MIRQGITTELAPITAKDQSRIGYITCYAICQCIFMFVVGATVLECVWVVENGRFDYDMLARVMYLYSSEKCRKGERQFTHPLKQLALSNNTRGFDVLPIKWKPAMITESAKLAESFRTHMQYSIALHIIWLISSLVLRVVTIGKPKMWLMKTSLLFYFLLFLAICVFDMVMAIMYISHLQQSLTKGMILMNSGWLNLQVGNHDDFAGWLPLSASVAWMRGVVFFAVNVYCTHMLYNLKKKINKREVTRKIAMDANKPIPEPMVNVFNNDEYTLYYRVE